MAKSTPTPKTSRPRRRGSGGRPHAITPEVSERICGLLELGMYPEQAAESCGISKTTYYRWRAEGEQAAVVRRVAEEAGEKPPAETPLVKAQREFWQASQKAMAGTEALYLRRIAEAAMGGATFTEVRRVVEHVKGPDGKVEARVTSETRTERNLMPDWKAASWILSRGRAKQRWAERTEVSGPDGGPVESQINVGEAALEHESVGKAVDDLLADALGAA